MSQSGHVIFYGMRKHPDPPGLIRELIELIEPGKVGIVARSVKGDREWRMIRKLNRAKRRWLPQRTAMLVSGEWYEQENPRDLLDTNSVPSIEELSSLYLRQQVLSISLYDSSLCESLNKAIKSEVPEAIRGDYNPGEVRLSVGRHDVIDYRRQCRRLGRVFFSIHFRGYGEPKDYRAAPEAILAAEGVQAVKRRIEDITGPLKQYMYWH